MSQPHPTQSPTEPASLSLVPPPVALPDPPLPTLTPPADSRLAQLHNQYADLKAAADEAASRLKAVTDAIKSELNAAAPDQAKIELSSPGAPTLRLSYSESWTLDSTKLKAEHPETWVRYAKRRGAWTLRAVKGA